VVPGTSECRVCDGGLYKDSVTDIPGSSLHQIMTSTTINLAELSVACESCSVACQDYKCSIGYWRIATSLMNGIIPGMPSQSHRCTIENACLVVILLHAFCGNKVSFAPGITALL